MPILLLKELKKVYLVLYYRIKHLKCSACLIHKTPLKSKMENSPDFKSKEFISK